MGGVTTRRITMPYAMDESRVFDSIHLPHLLRYVVAIMWDPNLQLGAGVLVKVQGRHFLATAAHCIKKNPEVRLCTLPVKLTTPVEMRSLRILDAGWHDDPGMDIGYLEISDPESAELGWDQLLQDQAPDGDAHIIGYPTARAQIDFARKVILLGQNTFSTHLIEATATYLKFSYPKYGSKYDADTGTWVPGEFPATPEGFSGGGCFGVSKLPSPGGMDVFEYNLYGIQSSRGEVGRYVKVIPIKQWCDLLISRGLYRG